MLVSLQCDHKLAEDQHRHEVSADVSDLYNVVY